LKDGGTEVTFEASGRAAIHGGPSIALAERFRHPQAERAGERVYRIPAPGPIRSVAGVARFEGEGPPPWGPWSVEFSLDGGKSWRAGVEGLTLTPAESQWGGGKFAYVWAQEDLPSNLSNEVWIRFGNGTIQAAEVYATYEDANDTALDIAFGWTEGEASRSHRHSIGKGVAADSWIIPTGEGVHTRWVEFVAR
jgi:hypothetical protein